MSASELAPCPWCARVPGVDEHPFATTGGFASVRVVCPCGVEGPTVKIDYTDANYRHRETSRAEAIAAWNRRATPVEAQQDALDFPTQALNDCIEAMRWRTGNGLTAHNAKAELAAICRELYRRSPVPPTKADEGLEPESWRFNPPDRFDPEG
jgi:hypothetical protein